MKTCKNCNIEKSFTEYCKRKEEKDGLHRYCKICMRQRLKNEYSNDKEKHLKRTKQYQIDNREYFRQKSKSHYHNNKDYYREWNQNKMDTDPLFRLRHAINALINHHLKEGKSQSSIEYLGCTIQEYKTYLEPMFSPEMNWDNYGSYWEIDHIYPLSKGGSFNYTNTQPLTINDNRSKSDNIYYHETKH
jgi:5-methylcytosine-specific restriction endonuclease McrA